MVTAYEHLGPCDTSDDCPHGARCVDGQCRETRPWPVPTKEEVAGAVFVGTALYWYFNR